MDLRDKANVRVIKASRPGGGSLECLERSTPQWFVLSWSGID
ncbi:hypothetical protein W823_24200 [Williamsia sp. D3]|nr:hypothetical protein W823_24200 [Williamsia sp. D3]